MLVTNLKFRLQLYANWPTVIYFIQFPQKTPSIYLINFSRFDVTEPPRYGRLERLRGNGRWVTTKRFYTRQLEKGKLRYVHTKGNPSTDMFKFVVSVQGMVSTTADQPGEGFFLGVF